MPAAVNWNSAFHGREWLAAVAADNVAAVEITLVEPPGSGHPTRTATTTPPMIALVHMFCLPSPVSPDNRALRHRRE
jgi:hypothetical protein